MDPKIWGKAWWQLLFSSALGYSLDPTIDDQYAYSRFYMLLSRVLPCESCKVNFENHFRNVPINFYLHSRKALLDWVLILHNEVNKTLGKSPITLEEAVMKYLGPETIRTSVYQQCMDSPASPHVAKMANFSTINDWIAQPKSNCPTTTPISVRGETLVEGFNFTTMDYKDTMILILLGGDFVFFISK